MDYEQKYKETLECIQEILDSGSDSIKMSRLKLRLQPFFDELKESEDERVRKEIISLISSAHNHRAECKNWIAWLEKQGKEQPIIRWHSISEEPEEMKELFCEWESDDATWHEVAFYHSYNKTFWDGERQVENVIRWAYIDELLEKQGEQKSYDELPQTPHKYEVGNWIVSKYGSIYQVKEVLKGSYNLLCESGAEEINSISQVDNSSRLLTMHDIVEKQKPIKWSEEDDEYLQDTINYFNVDDALQHSEKEIISWLKSLKERIK